jgi:hypothetical protein
MMAQKVCFFARGDQAPKAFELRMRTAMTKNRRPKIPTDLAEAMRELKRLRERVTIAEALASKQPGTHDDRAAKSKSFPSSPRNGDSDEQR